MPHKLTRAEVEKLYPKSMFPNEYAWKATVETYVGRFTCQGCEQFVDLKFYAPECCLSFDGICRKLGRAVFCKNAAPCSTPKNPQQ